MTKLKACPFCGSKGPKVEYVMGGSPEYRIYCSKCGVVFSVEDCNASKEQVISGWDRRASDA